MLNYFNINQRRAQQFSKPMKGNLEEPRLPQGFPHTTPLFLKKHFLKYDASIFFFFKNT